ncbi:hypothetical protein [Halorussus marinus]|uniref:hypothetical protein n=1 Tax=Halorussus marinus TaxID=2505976 RepID=UPI001092BEDD|nr:hypothetical protein [Halorussus marinus]
MKRDRDLPEDPEVWRDPDVLEALYVERGWSVDDIADHFEALGAEAITPRRVRWLLHTNDIRCGRNDRPPVTGTAAQLWQTDKDAVGGDRT